MIANKKRTIKRHGPRSLLVLSILLSGCLSLQTAAIWNESPSVISVMAIDGEVIVIDTDETVFAKIGDCLPVFANGVMRFYGVPNPTTEQVFPADAYWRTRGIYGVSLIHTDNGLFFYSRSSDLVPVQELDRLSACPHFAG